MAISLITTDTANNGSGGDMTFNLSGVAQGDVSYVIYGLNELGNASMAMTTAGYTELCELQGNDDFDANFGAYRKVQGATPDTSAVTNGTGAGNAGVMYLLRGVDNTTPEDATTTTAINNNSFTPNAPSITTVTANAWVIAAGCGTTDDTSPTAPSGYGNLLADANSIAAGNIATMAATKTVATPAADDPGAFSGLTVGDHTAATSSWAACTIAVRPAAVPTGRSHGYIMGENDNGPKGLSFAGWRRALDARLAKLRKAA